VSREERVAFIQSQIACMMAEMEAMKAENAAAALAGQFPVHGSGAFEALPDRFGLGHNAVISYLMGDR
jgi:hypothetical protein